MKKAPLAGFWLLPRIYLFFVFVSLALYAPPQGPTALPPLSIEHDQQSSIASQAYDLHQGSPRVPLHEEVARFSFDDQYAEACSLYQRAEAVRRLFVTDHQRRLASVVSAPGYQQARDDCRIKEQALTEVFEAMRKDFAQVEDRFLHAYPYRPADLMSPQDLAQRVAQALTSLEGLHDAATVGVDRVVLKSDEFFNTYAQKIKTIAPEHRKKTLHQWGFCPQDQDLLIKIVASTELKEPDLTPTTYVSAVMAQLDNNLSLEVNPGSLYSGLLPLLPFDLVSPGTIAFTPWGVLDRHRFVGTVFSPIKCLVVSAVGGVVLAAILYSLYREHCVQTGDTLSFKQYCLSHGLKVLFPWQPLSEHGAGARLVLSALLVYYLVTLWAYCMLWTYQRSPYYSLSAVCALEQILIKDDQLSHLEALTPGWREKTLEMISNNIFEKKIKKTSKHYDRSL